MSVRFGINGADFRSFAPGCQPFFPSAKIDYRGIALTKAIVSEPAAKKDDITPPPAEVAPPPAVDAKSASAKEQMEQFEADLKEKDWGHQPC